MAISLLQWLVSAMLPLLHPFFVSVIDINHNAKDATVEISVRVFADDLEKTLGKYTSNKVDFSSTADKVFLGKQVASYMSQTLKLKINGQPANLQFIGYEVQQESVWSYFEISKVPTLRKAEIDCGLLYDFTASQTNIFHVKANGTEKNYKLDYPKQEVVFDF